MEECYGCNNSRSFEVRSQRLRSAFRDLENSPLKFETSCSRSSVPKKKKRIRNEKFRWMEIKPLSPSLSLSLRSLCPPKLIDSSIDPAAYNYLDRPPPFPPPPVARHSSSLPSPLPPPPSFHCLRNSAGIPAYY